MKTIKQDLGKVSVTCNGTWDGGREYYRLSIVNDGLYASYISKKFVPSGTPLSNIEYWQPLASLKDDIKINYEKFKKEVLQLIADIQIALRGTRLVVQNEAERNELTWMQVAVGCEVYEIDSKLTYILDSIVPILNIKEWHLESDSRIDSVPMYELEGTFDNFTSDRAIADRWGHIIDEYYVTRNMVNNYIKELVQKYIREFTILPGSTKPEDLSQAVLDLIGHDSITNLADEEDITDHINANGSHVLKFKDKEYYESDGSGLGRVYLRQNKVQGVNTLTQDMISKPNTIYHIQYDYTLQDQVINLPINSVLLFNGGSINCGTIITNNVYIIESGKKIFSNITFSGKIKNESLSVLSFGAIPTPIDSTSLTSPIYNYNYDNTEYFQAAINSGFNIAIPANHFYIKNTLILRQSITISGENNNHFFSRYTPYSGGALKASSEGSTILYSNSYKPMFIIKHRNSKLENFVIDYTQVTKSEPQELTSIILLDLSYGLNSLDIDVNIIGRNSITYNASGQAIQSNNGNDIIGIQTYNSGDNGDWDGGMYLSGSSIKGRYENLKTAIILYAPTDYDWSFQQNTGYVNANEVNIITFNCKQSITAFNCGNVNLKGWAQTAKYFKKAEVLNYPVIEIERCYDCVIDFYVWDCEHYYQMNDTDYYRNALATKIIRSRNTFDKTNPSVFQSYDTAERNRYPLFPINKTSNEKNFRNIIISDNEVNSQIAFNNALSDFNKKYGITPTITAYPGSVKDNLALTTVKAGGKFYFTGNVKTINYSNNTTSGNLAIMYDNSNKDSLETDDFVEIYFPHANKCFYRFGLSTLAIAIYTNNGVYPKRVSFVYNGNEYPAVTKFIEGSFANTYYLHSLSSNIVSGGLRIRLYGFTSECKYNELDAIKYLYVSHCYLSSAYKSNNFLDLNGDSFQELVGDLRIKKLPTYTGGSNTYSKTRNISYHAIEGYGRLQLKELDQNNMPVVILDNKQRPSIGFKNANGVYNSDGSVYVNDTSSFTSENTIYKIYSSIDLGGTSLTIPANCTLDFQGGSFRNGTIVFNNTLIKCIGDISNCITATITGTYKEGQIIYDSTLKKMKLWNGTTWTNLDGTTLA